MGKTLPTILTFAFCSFAILCCGQNSKNVSYFDSELIKILDSLDNQLSVPLTTIHLIQMDSSEMRKEEIVYDFSTKRKEHIFYDFLFDSTGNYMKLLRLNTDADTIQFQNTHVTSTDSIIEGSFKGKPYCEKHSVKIDQSKNIIEKITFYSKGNKKPIEIKELYSKIGDTTFVNVLEGGKIIGRRLEYNWSDGKIAEYNSLDSVYWKEVIANNPKTHETRITVKDKIKIISTELFRSKSLIERRLFYGEPPQELKVDLYFYLK